MFVNIQILHGTNPVIGLFVKYIFHIVFKESPIINSVLIKDISVFFVAKNEVCVESQSSTMHFCLKKIAVAF